MTSVVHFPRHSVNVPSVPDDGSPALPVLVWDEPEIRMEFVQKRLLVQQSSRSRFGWELRRALSLGRVI